MIKIVSGGQTGSDRAALDVAIQLKITHGGWCPRGRVAEDGIIADCYQLKCPDGVNQEPDGNIFNERTKLNIRDSDATLILVPSLPLPSYITDGTNLTIAEVIAKKKPYLLVNLSDHNSTQLIIDWISKNNIEILNVAGSRESQSNGIYEVSKKVLTEVFINLG